MRLHGKALPWFVSDVMQQDLDAMMAWVTAGAAPSGQQVSGIMTATSCMRESGCRSSQRSLRARGTHRPPAAPAQVAGWEAVQQLGKRWQGHLAAGRWTYTQHEFWTTPFPFWWMEQVRGADRTLPLAPSWLCGPLAHSLPACVEQAQGLPAPARGLDVGSGLQSTRCCWPCPSHRPPSPPPPSVGGPGPAPAAGTGHAGGVQGRPELPEAGVRLPLAVHREVQRRAGPLPPGAAGDAEDAEGGRYCRCGRRGAGAGVAAACRAGVCVYVWCPGEGGQCHLTLTEVEASCSSMSA